MHLYFCDVDYPRTPCVFTDYSMRNLWKRSGGDIARCIRHGSLICNEAEETNKREFHRKRREANERRILCGRD